MGVQTSVEAPGGVEEPGQTQRPGTNYLVQQLPANQGQGASAACQGPSAAMFQPGLLCVRMALCCLHSNPEKNASLGVRWSHHVVILRFRTLMLACFDVANQCPLVGTPSLNGLFADLLFRTILLSCYAVTLGYHAILFH